MREYLKDSGIHYVPDMNAYKTLADGYKKIYEYRKKIDDEHLFLSQTIKNLSREEIGDIYEIIFNKINSEVCANCPKASYTTIEEAQKNDDYLSKEAGCCSLCAIQNGYLEIAVEKLNKLGFNKKYGFFDPNKKACKLPRKLRSSTCLKFVCDAISHHISEINNGILDLLNSLNNKTSALQKEWDKI